MYHLCLFEVAFYHKTQKERYKCTKKIRKKRKLFRYKVSNAKTEAINNKIKAISRIVYHVSSKV